MKKVAVLRWLSRANQERAQSLKQKNSKFKIGSFLEWKVKSKEKCFAKWKLRKKNYFWKHSNIKIKFTQNMIDRLAEFTD